MSDQPSFRLPARVDLETAPAVLEAARSAVDGGARSFDLADCRQFDSTLIAVLLDASRRVTTTGGVPPANPAASGRTLRILNTPTNLRKLAALYGVDELILDQRD